MGLFARIFKREPHYVIDIKENRYAEAESVWEWIVERDWHIIDLGAEPTELGALERAQAAIRFDIYAVKGKDYWKRV